MERGPLRTGGARHSAAKTTKQLQPAFLLWQRIFREPGANLRPGISTINLSRLLNSCGSLQILVKRSRFTTCKGSRLLQANTVSKRIGVSVG